MRKCCLAVLVAATLGLASGPSLAEGAIIDRVDRLLALADGILLDEDGFAARVDMAFPDMFAPEPVPGFESPKPLTGDWFLVRQLLTNDRQRSKKMLVCTYLGPSSTEAVRHGQMMADSNPLQMQVDIGLMELTPVPDDTSVDASKTIDDNVPEEAVRILFCQYTEEIGQDDLILADALAEHLASNFKSQRVMSRDKPFEKTWIAWFLDGADHDDYWIDRARADSRRGLPGNPNRPAIFTISFIVYSRHLSG